MEVGAVVGFLRRSWVLVVAVALVGLAIGAVAFAAQPPVFRATAQVLVSTESAATTAEILQGNDFAISRVETYAQLVGSDLVLSQVIDELGLDESTSELALRVTGVVVPSTALIEVRVDAPSADEAADVANATARSLQAAVVELESTAQAASPIALTVTDAATVPSSAASPRLELSLGLGLMLGLLLGIAIAIVRASTDPRIEAEHDLRRLVDAPVLGRIASSGREPSAAGVVAEDFRSLRTSIRSLGLDPGARAVLVVGAGSGASEGRAASATTMRLAVALAESGARVLVIDAHLGDDARPEPQGAVGAVGLSDMLGDDAELVDATTPWQETSVDVLAAGASVAHSSELLDSAAMVDLLDEARSVYDWVLLDAPALPAVTDAAVLAQHPDGVLLIVRERRTRTPDLARAIDALDRAGAALLGVVLLAPGASALRRRRREPADAQP